LRPSVWSQIYCLFDAAVEHATLSFFKSALRLPPSILTLLFIPLPTTHVLRVQFVWNDSFREKSVNTLVCFFDRERTLPNLFS
jgi:hypothetical protein